jgi:EAL domain-containing protein (putative c-di-GMP-specific phosphodiesterase class I)
VGAKTVFALADSGLPPPRLEIEITESVTHALGIETTAEGVENTALLMELPAHGCSSVQGYLFAEPTTLADVHRLFVEDNGVLQNVA